LSIPVLFLALDNTDLTRFRKPNLEEDGAAAAQAEAATRADAVCLLAVVCVVGMALSNKLVVVVDVRKEKALEYETNKKKTKVAELKNREEAELRACCWFDSSILEREIDNGLMMIVSCVDCGLGVRKGRLT
jgi:hypothetical protein